jgi:hypothetical protein
LIIVVACSLLENLSDVVTLEKFLVLPCSKSGKVDLLVGLQLKHEADVVKHLKAHLVALLQVGQTYTLELSYFEEAK